MKSFFFRMKVRFARKRLSRALDKCTLADLERASALNRWLQTTQFVPGDKIVLTFDGEKSDVILQDFENKYFGNQDQQFLKNLKDET